MVEQNANFKIGKKVKKTGVMFKDLKKNGKTGDQCEEKGKKN